MPDTLDANGIQTKTLNEIIAEFETQFKNIYGVDINIEQNSPDGQLINILAQAGVEVREIVTEVYNSFDPDSASGSVLDQRVAINNIQRKGGTFTLVDIDVTTDRNVDLDGLDGDFNNVNGTGFTVQDNAGNEFILVDSATFRTGMTSASFRAKEIGEVNVTPDTITEQVTVVLGVTAVNNPSGATQTGQNEETDAQLRRRRQSSVAIASFGNLDGIQGLIANLDGVTDVQVYENETDTTDSDGIPPHAIWAVVEGGANTDIANVIYERKSYGANMKGSVEVEVERPTGIPFVAKFDRPTNEDLYIQFNLKPTKAGQTIDQSVIKQNIVDALTYSIGQAAETGEITAVARQAIVDSGVSAAALDVEISDDDVTYVEYLEVPTIDAKWVLDTTRITITEI